VALYSVTQHSVNAIHRFGLHSRQHMGIKIDGDTDARMPQPLLRDLRMDAGLEHVRGMGMPQIMEADMTEPAPPQELDKDMGKLARLYWLAILACDHMMIIGEPHTDP